MSSRRGCGPSPSSPCRPSRSRSRRRCTHWPRRWAGRSGPVWWGRSALAEGRGLGLLGGTFDPPHVGHVVVAANVRWALGLEQVLLVVANEPWQKAHLPVSPAADRLKMVEAAVAGVDGVAANAIEIERGGPSYTADTLAELGRRCPGVPLHVVLGSDAAAGLDTWRRAEEVRASASIVVVTRPGAETATV